MSRLLALLFVGLLTLHPSHASETVRIESLGPVKVGEILPDFAGHDDRTGAVISSAKMFGTPSSKGVVVSVFATWCGPCKRGLPVLNSVVKRHAAGWDLLLIDFKEPQARVRPFLEDLHLDAKLLIDTYGKVCEKLGVNKALPKTFVVNPEGIVVAIFTEEGSDFETQLEQVITAASPARP